MRDRRGRRGRPARRAAGSRRSSSPRYPADQVDTPIGRAAQAAVGVRGRADGPSWPRPSRCRLMTIANQKGGVGKTTTAVNIAAASLSTAPRVLVIDLDPQGNASTALDVDTTRAYPTSTTCWSTDRPLAEVIQPGRRHPEPVLRPATIDLAGAEIELVSVVARESRLSRAIAGLRHVASYDYVFIDCPPSLGLLTVNALVAAQEVLIPIQCEYYALEGVQQLLNIAAGQGPPQPGARRLHGPAHHVRRPYPPRRDVADDVRAHFGDTVLRTVIPRNVRVSEAPS